MVTSRGTRPLRAEAPTCAMAAPAPPPKAVRVARVARVAPLLVVLLLVSLAGCSSDGGGDGEGAGATSTTTSAEASTTTGPEGTTAPDGTADPIVADAPVAGTCRPVRSAAKREQAAVDERSVPCAEAHGSEVVAVVDLPDAIAQRLTPALIEAGGAAYAAALGDGPASCDGPLQAALDRVTLVEPPPAPFSRVVQGSALRGSYFVPTPDAWRAGARWLSCELTATAADGTGLPYAGSLADLGGRLLPSELASCIDFASDTVIACTGAAPRLVAQGTVTDTLAPDQAFATTACGEVLTALGASVPGDLTVDVRAQDEDSTVVTCLVAASTPLTG